ncbi:hypothetical protein JAO73_17400 [Hymenobacter sp. BT523]|uniref:hypothetical protein n=1 Tax=Hymenobacter sp. BT523 TaxID=2795725 RepID=UPI0018EB577D|nr:hypothetical protein [Hymenobacter sp. BT523]MBJ6110804.1 hypothetical protein [Hymenobacter sp. BT523]
MVHTPGQRAGHGYVRLYPGGLAPGGVPAPVLDASNFLNLPAADNLGNHTATRNLDLSAYQLVGNGGTTGLSVNFQGWTGIGISAPATPLHLRSTITYNMATLESSQTGPHLNLVKTGAGRAFVDYIGSTETGPRAGALELRGYSSVQINGDNDATTADLTVKANGFIGLGTPAPFSQLANTDQNIVGSDGNGGNPGTLTWLANQNGFVGGFFNASPTSAAANGLGVKIASSSALALDVSRHANAGTPGTSLLTVRGNGNVGLGTGAPQGHLHLVSDAGGGGAVDDYLFDEYGGGDQTIYMRRANGTLAAPVALATGDYIGRLAFVAGRNGAVGYAPSADIKSYYQGDGSTNLADLRFSTSNTERVRLDKDGNLGIGTISPDARLDVEAGAGNLALKVTSGLATHSTASAAAPTAGATLAPTAMVHYYTTNGSNANNGTVTLGTGTEGQVLTVGNFDPQNLSVAYANGTVTLGANGLRNFIYLAGGWRLQ